MAMLEELVVGAIQNGLEKNGRYEASDDKEAYVRMVIDQSTPHDLLLLISEALEFRLKAHKIEVMKSCGVLIKDSSGRII